MQEINLYKLQKKVRKVLDEERYRHTLGVMYTSAALAMKYDPELLEAAQTAGLLHDCAKCIPNDKKLKLCEKHGIEVSELEAENPSLLHARLGAFLAKERYGITDEEVLSAIRWHTTGRPAMTLLEKIVFIADFIEPMRWKASNLNLIRQKAFEDIDKAVYLTLSNTLTYLENGKARVDETTAIACNYYRELMEQEE